MGKKITTYLSNNTYYTPLWENVSITVGVRNHNTPNVNISNPATYLNGNIGNPDDKHLFLPNSTSHIVVQGESGLFKNINPSDPSDGVILQLWRSLLGIDLNNVHVTDNNYWYKYIRTRGISYNNFLNYIAQCQGNPHIYMNIYQFILILYVVITDWHDDLVTMCYNNSVWRPAPAQDTIAQAQYSMKFSALSGGQVISISNFIIILQMIEELMIKNSIGKWKHIGNYPPGEIRQRMIYNEWYFKVDIYWKYRGSREAPWPSDWTIQSYKIYWDNETQTWKLLRL